MLQVRSTQRLDQVETGLRVAAEAHGARVLAVTRVGPDALTFTLCLSELCDPLLAADARFAAFLPTRVAACAQGGSVTLETISPREFCRMIHRPDLDPLAIPLEDRVHTIMQHWAGRQPYPLHDHPATEDQINMRAALPQRIDCHGTKVEELAGTGVHDAQGG
jgi:uncharacterized protein (DUF302 family)